MDNLAHILLHEGPKKLYAGHSAILIDELYLTTYTSNSKINVRLINI
jgi:hypothetical protein